MKAPLSIGLIGCGNIGREIARYLESSDRFVLKRIHDTHLESAERLSSELQIHRPEISSLTEILLDCEVVIEAASKEAVVTLLQQLNSLNTQNTVLVMSSGGLTENMDLYDTVNRGNIFVPAGAIGGLDALSAVKDDLASLCLTTTKPAAGLGEMHTCLNDIVLYDGNLNGAVEKYPKNINVAATLFLSTRFNDLKVRIISSPYITRNCHEIEAKGSFGRMVFRFENEPSQNPKTSMLTIYSVKYALNQLLNQLNFTEL